jgi:hypothetical protein
VANSDATSEPCRAMLPAFRVRRQSERMEASGQDRLPLHGAVVCGWRFQPEGVACLLLYNSLWLDQTRGHVGTKHQDGRPRWPGSAPSARVLTHKILPNGQEVPLDLRLLCIMA